jgi:hypothetical protein
MRVISSAVVPVLCGLSLALAGCGTDEPDSVSSGADQELQERLDRLEREADEREADAQARIEAAEKKAREAKGKARAARRKAERERAREEASAPEPEVEPASNGGQSGGIAVPDVTGLDHQAAQDALQGEGLWSLDERDCTGQGRLLLFDRNWEVVSTDPPAGTQVSEDTTITICSKKQGE